MPRGIYDRSKKSGAVKKTPLKKADLAHPEVLRLDETTLLKLKGQDAETRALKFELQNHILTKEKLLAQVDPQGVLKALDKKIQQLSQEYSVANQEYGKVRDEIGSELGIDMKEYSYDDKTGVLHNINETPPTEELPTKTPAPVQ